MFTPSQDPLLFTPSPTILFFPILPLPSSLSVSVSLPSSLSVYVITFFHEGYLHEHERELVTGIRTTY